MDLMYRDDFIGYYTPESILIKHQTKECVQYFGERTSVTGNQLSAFIRDRVISNSRRDIENVLAQLKLTQYDEYELAKATKLINPMDGFWLREYETQTYQSYAIPKLAELFGLNKLTLENTMSSGGQNIKYYSKYKDKFGIVKKRLFGRSFDTESEIAVYNLAELLEVETCPVYRVDNNHTFSEFKYNFLKESIIHMRHALTEYSPEKEIYPQLIKSFPNLKEDFMRMVILDFITAQDDRHMSNLAISGNQLYPLYDNGRSLFWEDDEGLIQASTDEVKLYSKTFGSVGTYYNLLETLSEEGVFFSKLVNLNVGELQITSALEDAGYTGTRLTLLVNWILMCINELKILDQKNLGIGRSSIFNSDNAK